MVEGKMLVLRCLLVVAACFLATACGDTNPFIGKWKLVNPSDFLCALLVGNIEIPEKLFKSPFGQISYSLQRDGKGYIIDTHEPGKNAIIPNINPDNTMTLNMGKGTACKFERIS
jgi:hypothetical protein